MGQLDMKSHNGPPENSRESPQPRSRDNQKKTSAPVSPSDTQLLSSKPIPCENKLSRSKGILHRHVGSSLWLIGNNELQGTGIFQETSWWEKEQTEAWSQLEEDLVFL